MDYYFPTQRSPPLSLLQIPQYNYTNFPFNKMRVLYEWMTHPHWPRTFSRYFCLQKKCFNKKNRSSYWQAIITTWKTFPRKVIFLACHDPSTPSSRTLTIKPFVQSYAQNNLLTWHLWQIERSESCRRNIEKLREQSPCFSSKCFMRATNLESICALSMEIVRECILNRSLLNLF